MSWSPRRVIDTVSDIASVHGSSSITSAGAASGFRLSMRKSSVCGAIVFSNLSQGPRVPTAQKSRQGRWRLLGMLELLGLQLERNPSSASGFGNTKYQK